MALAQVVFHVALEAAEAVRVIHYADGVRAPLPVLLANCILHKISDHVF